jgi:carboxynorspermidine decarboxylase
MPDLLVYRQSAEIEAPGGAHPYIVCGKSCLAGDIFGEAAFNQVLKPGDRLSIRDVAGYTMVKKNWFNGVQMPSIVINEGGDNHRLVREFSFEDYLSSLS